MWPWSKEEKSTGNNRQGAETRNTRSSSNSNRQSPSRQQRNIITGDGMDTDDCYTANGNMHGSGMAMGYQQGNQGNMFGPGMAQGYPQENRWHVSDNHPRQGYAGHQQPMVGYGRGQAQTQGHIFRTAQASKQMVYEVFGNCITMLEELESRELRQYGHGALPRSDIHLPSQDRHDDGTVQRKLETQLLLFQSQMDSCDKGIKDEVKQELIEGTLAWNASREDRKIPNGVTDKYAAKLVEVLEKGKTQHPKEFYEQPSIDEEGMRRAMQGIVEGQHRQVTMDEDFKKNPDKKAKAPKLRSGAGTSKGAERMARGNPDLAPVVDRHIKPNLR